MTMVSKKWGGTALASSVLAVALAGCGVVYEPQQFTESRFSYGYAGDLDVDIDLVPLTFFAARAANADGYAPRTLPPAFAQVDPASRVSVQQRLAAVGLDRVDPAVVFEQPSGFTPYDGTREVLPQGQRDENRAPLPTLDLTQNPLDTSGNGYGSADTLPRTGTTPIAPIDPLTLRREALGRTLPAVSAPMYRIGPGDEISLQSRARALPSFNAGLETDGGETAGTQRLLVQDNGEIFIPEAGPVRVSGLTLSEARARISEQLQASQIGFDTGVQITQFGSRKIAVSGIAENRLVPVTVRPTTLGEVVTLSGGLGNNPENMIVRVLRGGDIFEMPGDRVAGSSEMTRRVLLDGDIVSVAPAYDLDLALTYFDQQLRLRSLERNRLADTIARRGEERAAQGVERDRLRLQIELENYTLQADRLRQEAQIARLASRRETDRLNEDARLANILARQAYLDQLRALEETNRNALRTLRVETREVAIASQAERTRRRNEIRQLLEFELRELELNEAQAQRARTVFADRDRLGGIERDYVTVAGETLRQTTMPLPFEGRLTLNRVLYEQTNGINLTTGDTSEIYVFRAPRDGNFENRLIAFHLDASNPAALAVASMFEMRPDDVVYVNPQLITTWNRVLTQILPSTGLLQNAATAAGGL